MDAYHSAKENLTSDEYASPGEYALSGKEASLQEESSRKHLQTPSGEHEQEKPSEEHSSSKKAASENEASRGLDATFLQTTSEDNSQDFSQLRRYKAPMSYVPLTFRSQFISSRGNEYFCEIDEEYITDRFNLTGLNTEVPYYQYALDLITDVFDLDADDELREQIERAARHLYGLIHARYIVTTRGLTKMAEKYKRCDFGKCPRVFCDAHPLLPMGNSDIPNVDTVKLYCPKCEDTYNPKSSRHASIDGAYFGSSFHNMLFQVYPALVPEKSIRRYEPRVYGFRVHAAAALARWQDRQREQMQQRLRDVGVEAKYVEESEAEEDDIEETEEDNDEFGGGQRDLAGTAEGPSSRMDLGN